MKIVLMNEHGEYSVQEEAATLTEVLSMVSQLLRATGFVFDGQVVIDES